MISHLKTLLRPIKPSIAEVSDCHPVPSAPCTSSSAPSSLPSPTSDGHPASPTATVPRKPTAHLVPMASVGIKRAQQQQPTPRASADRFQLLQRMGDGAFSVVYKAYDRHLRKHVAIKVVRKFQMKATQRAGIYKEVAILRGLKHPNIVGLVDFRESQDYFYVIMDLVSGGELFNRIVELTYFSEALSRHVILQVAEAIRYLHNERGVVHRDIKPENILFEPIPHIPDPTFVSSAANRGKQDEGIFVPNIGGGGIGCVRLADFGLSKVIWNEPTLTPCGTVGYTAPEIVNDQKYSTGVDMWALGCVLYTLLCGFPPFYDEDIQTLTQKVSCGYYTFLSPWWDHISESAKDLISHLLTVNPEERYTIDEFLAHPWCQTPFPTEVGDDGWTVPNTTVHDAYEYSMAPQKHKTTGSTLASDEAQPYNRSTHCSADEANPQRSKSTIKNPKLTTELLSGSTLTSTAQRGAAIATIDPSQGVVPASKAADVQTKPAASQSSDSSQSNKRGGSDSPYAMNAHPQKAKSKRAENLRIDLQSLGLERKLGNGGLPSAVFTPGGQQRVVAKTPVTPILTLKEAFDVSYAVRRVEQEEKQRRQQRTIVPLTPGAMALSSRATPGLLTPRWPNPSTPNGTRDTSALGNGYMSGTATLPRDCRLQSQSKPGADKPAPTCATTAASLDSHPVGQNHQSPAPSNETARSIAPSSTPAKAEPLPPSATLDTVLASYTNPLFSPQMEAEDLDDDHQLIKTLFQRNADRLVSHIVGPASESASVTNNPHLPADDALVTVTETSSSGEMSPPTTAYTLHTHASMPYTPPLERDDEGSVTADDDSTLGYYLKHLDHNDNTLDSLPDHQAGLHMTPVPSDHSSVSERPVFELNISNSTLLEKRRHLRKKSLDKVAVVS
ncbi:MAPK-activated protein kinase Srk1 [Dimargaris xerosporica]|nr:MAPK-activated protein kinase Srk1 [Dimargaris xerosporica]